MKKKILTGVAMMAMLTTPPMMTSCGDDEINAVLQIIDLLISVDDLANTAWIAEDNSVAFEFSSNKTGAYYESAEGIQFNYQLDTNNNTLILTFSDVTLTFTVVEFKKNEFLVLKNSNGNLIRLIPFTGEE